MPRYIAFLRAINVGGHVVKMQRLTELFQLLGFEGIETFIASGNVIFTSPGRKAASVEAEIERVLQRELGYEVKTFVRTDAEIGKTAVHVPFEPLPEMTPSTLYVGFLKSAPPAAVKARLLAAQTPADDFCISGRELFWRCRVPSSESAFSGAKLEKMLGMPTTLRNINTVRRLAAKYPPKS